MKAIKIGRILMLLWTAIWIIGNSYFGWNKEPMSEIEKDFDIFCKVFMYISVWVYLTPIISIYEKIVKKYENN